MPSDTPTYDQLSALCAQMAAALEAYKHAMEGFAQAVRQDSGLAYPWPAQELALPAVDTALTAYRTLSPDPQWQISDEVERAAFEAWGKENGMDMHRHPLHYLFLAQETHAARQAWKAGVRYCINRARGEG